MRCLRLVSPLVVLCCLAGVSHADHWRVTDPVPPAPVAFGNVPIGNMPTATVTLQACNGAPDNNPCQSGGGQSGINSFNGVGAGCPRFTILAPPNLPLSLDNGMSRVFTIRYQPTARVTDSCTFTTVIPPNPPSDDTAVSFTVTGTGTGPELIIDPTPVAFGDSPVGLPKDTNVTLRNPGENTLNITSLAIQGANATDYAFTNQGCAGDNPCNVASGLATASLNPAGGNAVFGMRCTPSAAGARLGTLVIVTNDPVNPTKTAPLTCNGRVPEISVSASSHDFGSQRVGTTSGPFTFTISNAAGAADLVYAIDGTAAPRFTITCPGGDPDCKARTLSGGQSTTFDVTFSPNAAVAVNQQLTIDTNDPTPASDDPFVVTLTGTGVESIVSANQLDLGNVPVGTSQTANLTVTNSGSATLTISGAAPAALEIQGGGNQFAIVLPAGAPACDGVQSCTRTIGPVAAAGTTQIPIRCTPTAAGLQQATLVIHSDATMPTTMVPLRCTGTVPDVFVSDPSLMFGNQRVGVASAAKTFTVDNVGLAPMTYTISSGSTDFAVTCGAATCTNGSLAAGGRVTVSVVFNPATAGMKMANITVATPNDPDEPTTAVLVTGTGVEPIVAVDAPNPAPLAIGDVDVGASAGGAITLRNSGTADLAISTVTLVGGDAAQFAISGSGTGAQTLSSTVGSNTRSWTVTCTPTSIGLKSTTFRVTHDAPIVGSQTNVTVTCTGRGAIFTPSVVPPAKLDFGQVQVGMSSPPQTFTFTNTGNKPGRILMLTSTVNVFTPTTMANLATDIAVGASITVSVVFTPTNSDVVNAQVCAVHNGLGTPSCANVVGDGTSVGIDVFDPVDFGSVRFDAAPVTSPLVTIKNTGESTLHVTSITSGGAPFTLVNAPVLPFDLSLNETRTFQVRLTPTMQLGTVTRQITVGGTFTVGGTNASASISATARIVAPQVSMTSDTIDFGMFDIDDPGTAVTRSVTITNTGDAATGTDLHIAAPVLAMGAPDFAIVNGAPAIVPPGGTAMLTVRFDPTTAGDKNGRVTLGIDALTGLTYTVTLHGLAIDQNVMCTPATIMFPSTVRRQSSTPIEATVTNLDFAGNGTAASLDYTATIAGTDAGDFALPAADAAGSIAGNASKALPITFTPSVAGAGRTATLTISYDDGGPKTCDIMLVGEGRLRDVAASPATIDFGTIATGATVRISDLGSMLKLTSNEPAGATATTVTMLTVRGDDQQAFTVVGGDQPRQLPIGGSLDYDIEFSPDQAGNYEGDIDVFFDADPDKQYTVHVVGKAVDVDLRGGGCDSSGGGAGALVGLAALGLLFGRRRRGALAAAAALLIGIAGAGTARAQSDRGELDISTFSPATSTEPGLWNVMSPLIGTRGAFAFQLSFHNDSNPLVADYADGTGMTTTAELVTRRTALELGLAYALSTKLELGVDLPLYSQAGLTGCTTACGDMDVRGVDGASGTTLGDVAARVKANLSSGPTSFGAALTVTAPTAKTGQFAGSDGPTAHLQALLGITGGKRLSLLVNAGLRARKSSEVLGVSQGTDVTYGAGASIRAANNVWAIGEAYGSIGVVGAEGKVNPTQFALGIRYRAGSIVVGVGGGGGVFGQGVGSPELRGFASLALVTGQKHTESVRIVEPPPPPKDEKDDDGDGVANSDDKCPAVAEDEDGFQDGDGCPDLDNDGDGINDTADKCPDEAEDKDRWEDNDGCPDKDNDDDGIADADDKCPFEPEDKDGFNDNDGCDDPDNDHDGVIDVLDQCAMEPETINGNNDDDGCPDAGDPLYMVMPDRIEALEPITFTGKTTKLTKGATNVLNQIAAVLRADQSIKKIRVTVHVQPRDDGDQALTDKRAKEVRDLILKAGVEPERVEARGLGSLKPLVKPSAKGAEQINDRVEFIILERRTEPTTPKTTPPSPPPAPPKNDTPADNLN